MVTIISTALRGVVLIRGEALIRGTAQDLVLIRGNMVFMLSNKTKNINLISIEVNAVLLKFLKTA